MAHSSGKTQELVCRPDGTCRVVTLNHRFVGETPIEVVRTGTYEPQESGAFKFILTKDNETVEVFGALSEGGLVFSGDLPPFSFSKPTVLLKVDATQEKKLNGTYQLTMYSKANFTFVTFPETVKITDQSYTVTNAKGEQIEEGKLALKPLSDTDKTMRLTFASNTGKGRLHAKAWKDLYHGQIWTPLQGFTQAFPEYKSSAEMFDTIYLEKVRTDQGSVHIMN